MSDTVLLKVNEGIATITLNRPDFYNAITQELLLQLLSFIDQVKNNDTVKVLILTGAGKGFCAGADMHAFGANPSGKDVRDNLVMYYGTIVRRIVELEIPVIAAINGPAAGAGLGFALAADYKVMADTASMRWAFVNIALVPDAGAGWFLARAVGYNKALEIAIDGDKIPAADCLKHGLVNKVVAPEELMEAAGNLATKLSAKAPLAFAGTKRIMHYAMDHSLQQTIEYEAKEQAITITSEDHKQGVMAFLQKQTPNFQGK